MLQLSNIKIPYDKADEFALSILSKKIKVSEEDILDFEIAKMSVDARKSDRIMKICTVIFNVEKKETLLKYHKDIKEIDKYTYVYPKTNSEISLKHRPVIIGSGPSGIFAAYLLAEMGYMPLIIERGERVEIRTKTVNEFWEKGILNPESNVQYGEGGAGTFSDGKLTTRIKDLRAKKVMQIFVENGAPKEILYKNKPHLGTDNLKKIMINMRKRIIAWGGTFQFNSKVTDLNIKKGQIESVVINDSEVIPAQIVVLAIGNSSRDTFEMLYKLGIKIEAKPFAVGFRIEHKQVHIDEIQYGKAEIATYLGAADYKLTYQATNGRSVYSFCMCPGGSVIAASSEEKHLVVNGMSEYSRKRENANSAIIVSVYPNDFPGNHPLRGMDFQRTIEAKAYVLGGNNYFAPIQKMNDYLADRLGESEISMITPSYRPGYKESNLNTLYPDFINDALQEAFVSFGKKIKGFDSDEAILTGVETRSSSPIRILRDSETMQSISVKNIYPIGEGAGYSGGITSSAVDGVRVFEMISRNYLNIAKI